MLLTKFSKGHYNRTQTSMTLVANLLFKQLCLVTLLHKVLYNQIKTQQLQNAGWETTHVVIELFYLNQLIVHLATIKDPTSLYKNLIKRYYKESIEKVNSRKPKIPLLQYLLSKRKRLLDFKSSKVLNKSNLSRFFIKSLLSQVQNLQQKSNK